MNKAQTKSILILDDDPAIIEALSLLLEDAGYTMRTFSEGETLENMHADLPGVVLLDIWMSGKDGRDVCTLLKSQETTRDIPIILISAHRDIERIAKEAGADDFLAKPFGMREVVAKLGKYLA